MPSFDTPELCTIEIDLVAGDVRLATGDHGTTVVDVRPTDPSVEVDVRAAEQTRVERTATGVLIRAPRQRTLGLFGKPGSVDVTVELPPGSHVRGEASIGGFRAVGLLGECQVKLGAGSIQLGQCGPADLRTGAGAIEVDHVAGQADATTGSGRLRLGAVDGPAVLKNSNGDIWVGDVAGDLRASTANGSVTIGRAAQDVDASSANGDVRVAAVTCGSAALKTGMGEVEIGIAEGTAARLDVYTHFGRVHNELAAADGPGTADRVVEVRARTNHGDIVINRA
jgi:DUF4097 and DUF4098 domain-containing protein YvlB